MGWQDAWAKVKEATPSKPQNSTSRFLEDRPVPPSIVDDIDDIIEGANSAGNYPTTNPVTNPVTDTAKDGENAPIVTDYIPQNQKADIADPLAFFKQSDAFFDSLGSFLGGQMFSSAESENEIADSVQKTSDKEPSPSKDYLFVFIGLGVVAYFLFN